MALDPHWITGIQAGTPGPDKLHLRMEFDDWWFSRQVNHVNQRTLFILALTKWQDNIWSEDNTTADAKFDDLSYFGIAAIHGAPLTAWPKNAESKTWWYCAHGRTTFGTWHTPYMALYEQQLYRVMKALIEDTFEPDQHEKYNEAADSWRLPFWDWAMKKPTWNPALPEDQQYQQQHVGPNVPFVITQQKVEIRAGKGSATPTIKVRNPMFQFALREGTKFGDYGVFNKKHHPWVPKCRVTSRWPKTTKESDPEFENVYVNGQGQDYTLITHELQGSVDDTDPDYFANSLPEAVKRLLSQGSNPGEPNMEFEKFVTGQWNGGAATAYPSLEATHNNLHYFAGGRGYLGDPAVSAFDPLFWLHHCNIDRLLSIWQELYPAAYKRWLDTNGTLDGPNVELKPFRNEKGELFTSPTVSYKQKQFNYTYPEMQTWNYKDKQEYYDSIYKTIERLYSYSPKTALLLAQNAAVAKKQMAAMTAKNLAVENFPSLLVQKYPTAEEDTGAFGKPPHLEWTNEDYLLNILYEPYAIDGEAYAIEIYLGDVPDHTNDVFGFVDFAAVKTAISAVYNFSNPIEARGSDEHGCDNCRQQKLNHALRSGQVILTDYLIERIVQGVEYQGLTLTSLDQEEVLPYLKANLHWSIYTHSGRNIANDDPSMQRMRLSVARGPAVHNSNPASLSQYGPYTDIWNVTATGDEV